MVKKNSQPPTASDPHAGDYLLFVDTNVWLDFYRLPVSYGLKKTLETIARVHDRMISTLQVQMEFLKHRQDEISKTLSALKTEKDHYPQLPPIIADDEAVKALRRIHRDLKEQRKNIAAKIEQIMLQPELHDPVYQAVHSILAKPSDLILGQENDRCDEIHNLARKRWHLGYPPRKGRDTSIGDAVNWEWIIDCAKRKGGHVIIVSRDGDYGYVYGKDLYVNDWLQKEYRERIGQCSKIVLTNAITTALSIMGMQVPPEVKKAEQDLIIELSSVTATATAGALATATLS